MWAVLQSRSPAMLASLELASCFAPTKLDELPQLWNVFIGEMSLVGPRPEVPHYVDMFHERYQRILIVRPGITDIASIRFRDEERVARKRRGAAARVCPERPAVETRLSR